MKKGLDAALAGEARAERSLGKGAVIQAKVFGTQGPEVALAVCL